MNKIFIAGDSYCFYREDPINHWPARLAKNLGLELHGNGFPGAGFWPVRKLFLEFAQTKNFNETDLFVFCHTQPHRVLTSNPNFFENFDKNNEFYFKCIQSDDVDSWAVTTWYNELSTYLQGKTVIHLASFEHTELFSKLSGLKLLTPLLDICILSAGGSLSENGWGDSKVRKRMNDFHNHFSPAENINFGNFLTNIVTEQATNVYRGDFVYKYCE